MILLTVFWGNRFNNGNQVSGNSKSNPTEFSILESSSFLAQSISAVEPANQVSSSIGSPSSSTASAPQAQTNGNPTNDIYKQNVSELGADASNNPLSETGLLSSATAPATSIFYRSRNDSVPNISAQEALVADLQSGETYFKINGGTRWPLASLTKLMTAVMVMKNIDLKNKLTLVPADFSSGEEMDFFKTGSAYSASDFFTTMLLLSKNEAAEVFANNFGREKFINGLNEIAAEWEMNQTHFTDPAGLSIANQSTPQDLEKLALHLYQNYPKILETTRRKSAVITELGSGKKETISNINLFAGRSDFLGGKTGYTDEANGNLLSIFSYERRPIVIIVLGTSDRFGDTEKLFNWFKNNFRANK